MLMLPCFANQTNHIADDKKNGYNPKVQKKLCILIFYGILRIIFELMFMVKLLILKRYL